MSTTLTAANASPNRAFWVIAALSLIWNLIGVATYLMTVSLTDEAIEAMPAAEQAIYADVPAWATAAYAIAVFAGTLGSIALLARKAWAVPLFALSLAGIVVQMGQAFLMTDAIEVRGGGALAMPLLLIVIAIGLVAFSRSALSKRWLS